MVKYAAMNGNLFVVVAPSGAGKTSLVAALLGRQPEVKLSISYTTRAPRPGESDGREYHFVDRARFEAMIAAGEFLEWADVFGNLYGTNGPQTERLLSSGRDVVLVIDVQGAQQVRECGLAFVSIFVLPPSFSELEQRLRGRSKDSDAAIQRRLDVASSEVSGYHDYDYVIVNDDLDVAVDGLRAIVVAERARVNRMRAVADGIIATFPKREQD